LKEVALELRNGSLATNHEPRNFIEILFPKNVRVKENRNLSQAMKSAAANKKRSRGGLGGRACFLSASELLKPNAAFAIPGIVISGILGRIFSLKEIIYGLYKFAKAQRN